MREFIWVEVTLRFHTFMRKNCPLLRHANLCHTDSKVPYDAQSGKPISIGVSSAAVGRFARHANIRTLDFKLTAHFARYLLPRTASANRSSPTTILSSTSANVGEDSPPPYASISALSGSGSNPPETEDVVHVLGDDETILRCHWPMPYLYPSFEHITKSTAISYSQQGSGS